MRAKRKFHNIILPVLSAGFLLLFLVSGGIWFTKYLQNQIFLERTTQLNELTAQVRANLSGALDSYWSYLTIAVNRGCSILQVHSLENGIFSEPPFYIQHSALHLFFPL